MKNNRITNALTRSFCGCLFATLFLLTACQDNAFVKPSASGRPYEVLIVMDEELQKGPVGQTLDSLLTTDIIGLPASESFASLMHISRGNFTGGFKYFRNIVYVDINASVYTRTSVRFSRDENANGQYIIVIHAPSHKSFVDYCLENGRAILDVIDRGELKRAVANLKQKHSQRVSDMVKKQFDCEVSAPLELSNFRQRDNFMWAATPSMSMNFCVYSYPYEGPETFTKEYVLAKRDSVLGANILGDQPNDHMSTNFEMTDVTPIVVKGDYCMEARGMWEMSVAYLAGPFVSHSRVDTINNRVIVAEGFVMEFDKLNRTMMRTLEAAVWTLNLPAATDSAEVREIADKELAE